MRRHRQIAATPARPASGAWAAVSQMVVDTLDRSTLISRADLETAMAFVAPVGALLVAGGHLDRYPLVVVAHPVHLSITTVSGSDALQLDEDLTPVPGGSSAEDWIIYVPTPDPLGHAVRAAIAGIEHLSADTPPSDSSGSSYKVASKGLIDLDALARRRMEK